MIGERRQYARDSQMGPERCHRELYMRFSRGCLSCILFATPTFPKLLLVLEAIIIVRIHSFAGFSSASLRERAIVQA